MRAALILAGGKGTRASGCEKALFTYQGKSFLEHQIHTLSPIVDEILISCRDEKQRDLIYEMVHLPCIIDKKEEQGPVGGIYAGLLEMKSNLCFLVAGDMPLLNQEVISFLFEKAESDPSCAGVVPCWSSTDIEPLHAVYRKNALLSCLTENKNTRKMFTLLSQIPVQYIPVEKLRTYDSELRFLVNVNTHDELSRLEQNKMKATGTD